MADKCLICTGPLPPYKGTGRMPEVHKICGELKQTMTRLQRGLERLSAEPDIKPVDRSFIRTYLVSTTFSLLNQSFNATKPRGRIMSSTQQLDRVIQRLQRTASGRAALRAAGLHGQGQEATEEASGVFREEDI